MNIKRLVIIFIIILMVTSCTQPDCCKDCPSTEINFWVSWVNFVGLFLTWTAFLFRSKCRIISDLVIRNEQIVRVNRLIGMKVHHIIWIACGYLWVFGMLFGIVVWWIVLRELFEGDYELDENAFPIIRKILKKIGTFLNKNI